MCSIYKIDYAYKTNALREHFKGGKAVFTLPKMPIKCGGAPQKIMYLSEETWRKSGVRKDCDVHFYTSVGNMFPNCQKYADKLAKVVVEKNIDVHFKHVIKAVDGPNKRVTFATDDGDVTTDYDFLHVVPPQSCHPVFAPLAHKNTFIDVDAFTLRHKKYENVFAVGDAANAPTSKTAAGAFSQAPVVVNNLTRQMENKSLNASYDGYGSCPLFTGDK